MAEEELLKCLKKTILSQQIYINGKKINVNQVKKHFLTNDFKSHLTWTQDNLSTKKAARINHKTTDVIAGKQMPLPILIHLKNHLLHPQNHSSNKQIPVAAYDIFLCSTASTPAILKFHRVGKSQDSLNLVTHLK